jgi:hypothetical protein
MTTEGKFQVMSAAAALREFTLPELSAYVSVHPERIRVLIRSRPDLYEKTGGKIGNSYVWRVVNQEKLLGELGDADD